jgi:uncharacterized protein with HEPN domain
VRPSHAHASDPTKLRNDPVTQAAAQRWIEVLGEAASHISEEVQAASPDVPWRKIIGTRIILAHAYFHLDQDSVGSIVSDEIPNLRRHLAAALDAVNR